MWLMYLSLKMQFKAIDNLGEFIFSELACHNCVSKSGFSCHCRIDCMASLIPFTILYCGVGSLLERPTFKNY